MVFLDPPAATHIIRVSTPDDVDVNKHMFEFLCVSIYRQNRFLFVCCVVYIPPKTDENEYMLIFNLLEKICVKYKNNVIM